MSKLQVVGQLLVSNSLHKPHRFNIYCCASITLFEEHDQAIDMDSKPWSNNRVQPHKPPRLPTHPFTQSSPRLKKPPCTCHIYTSPSTPPHPNTHSSMQNHLANTDNISNSPPAQAHPHPHPHSDPDAPSLQSSLYSLFRARQHQEEHAA